MRPAGGLLGDSQPWIQWSWVRQHPGEIWNALSQHIELTLIAVGIGFAISLPLGYVAWRWRVWENPIYGVTGVLFTIPSLAFFALLIPLTGLGRTTAEIGLVTYTLLILVRGVVAGLDSVPPDVRDAARGLGYGTARQLVRVDIPLATPTIMAGVRLAVVTTIGLVTVASLVGAGGGLGTLISLGQQNDFRTQVVLGASLSVLLAAGFDGALVLVQRLLTPWARKGGEPLMFHLLHQVLDWYGSHWSGSNGVLLLLWYTVKLAGEAVLITLFVTLPVALYLGHTGRGGFLAINVTNVGRALPSIAVLVIAVQLWGIGAKPALITLVVLSMPPIMTTAYTGIRQVDRDVIDAARGMGMTGWQVLWKVEVPNAVPVIAGGIRTASVQAIAIVPLTAYVAYTSLGSLIVEGISVNDHVEIVAGSLLVVALALLAELGLATLQRLVTPNGVLVALHQRSTD